MIHKKTQTTKNTKQATKSTGRKKIIFKLIKF